MGKSFVSLSGATEPVRWQTGTVVMSPGWLAEARRGSEMVEDALRDNMAQLRHDLAQDAEDRRLGRRLGPGRAALREVQDRLWREGRGRRCLEGLSGRPAGPVRRA